VVHVPVAVEEIALQSRSGHLQPHTYKHTYTCSHKKHTKIRACELTH